MNVILDLQKMLGRVYAPEICTELTVQNGLHLKHSQELHKLEVSHASVLDFLVQHLKSESINAKY